LLVCFVVGVVLAFLIATTANGVVHQVAALVVLLGAGVAFSTAAIIDRLDRIGDLIEARTAPDDPVATARSPGAGKPESDHNRQTLELVEKLAALKRGKPPA
jgi:hypothetical protein